MPDAVSTAVGAGRCDVRIGVAGRDDAWDAFVDAVPGGHHVQSSRWGEVKRAVGWEPIRIVAARDARIVAGCQLLVRRLSRLGAVAYAARGPLVEDDDVELVSLVLGTLERVARDRGILYVKLQPPTQRAETALLAARSDLIASDLAAGPTATVRVDAGRPLDEIFRGLRRGARSNVRKAQRRGVTVRAGGEGDVPTFAALVAATARRQGFPPYPLEYYRAIWRAFAPERRARLLLAELDGEPLAGALAIAFADSVTYKMGAWGGARDGVHPNELMHWDAITWAHESGYRYYDFDGIDERVARALVAGESPPAARQGVTRFKLGFGGEVVLLPRAYDWTGNPALRKLLPLVAPRLRTGVRVAQRLLGRRG